MQSERTAIRMTSYLALDDLPLGPGPGLDHGPAERDKWAREFGLVDAHHTTAVVHIDRASEAPVTLTGLEIRVHERAEPPEAFHIGALGGGSFAVRSFAVNLDASPPEVRYDPGSEPTGPPIRFPYDLSGEERELFYILARTREYDVRWSAELHWVAGGKAGVTVIDDGGKPFRTVAPSRARMHRWDGGRWVPAG